MPNFICSLAIIIIKLTLNINFAWLLCCCFTFYKRKEKDLNKSCIFLEDIQVKVNVKLSPCITKYHAMKMYLLLKYHAMKWYLGSRGTAPSILNLSTRWRWVVSFMPWPLFPWGNNSLVPTAEESGWGEKFPASTRNQTLVIQPVV